MKSNYMFQNIPVPNTKTAYEFLINKQYSIRRASVIASNVADNSRARTENWQQNIKYIVLHHTSSGDAAKTLEYWGMAGVISSAHYMVDKDGTIISCVPEEKVAYHAGCGSKCNSDIYKNINSKSIGIEIINWGQLSKRSSGFYNYYGSLHRGQTPVYSEEDETWFEPYPEAQRRAISNLVKYLVDKYGIDPNTGIIGHGCVTYDRHAGEPVGFEPNQEWGWALNKKSTGGCQA
jgi:N-acetyl-anhydromuramyl-L-alanine amidase AmpD